jgi:DNA replication protein DnaC
VDVLLESIGAKPQTPSLTGLAPDERLRVRNLRESIWQKANCPNIHTERDSLLPEAKEWFRVYGEARDVVLRGGIAVLLGDRGTGKTQMAVELCREHAWMCASALYVRAAELFIKLRQAYGDNRLLTEEQAIAYFCSPRLLIIDEAQVRRHNEYENLHLTTIIDIRYGNGYPTVFIANATEPAFRQQAGDSIWDRTAETGAVWCCRWPSFRVKP